MSENTGSPADHRITVEFLGTDVENEPSYQLVYGASCSCGDLATWEALAHHQLDARIRKHLAAVGLMEQSYTQR